MQVAIVSKSDAIGGGASAVADSLCSALNHSGTTALHYCLYSGTGFNFFRRPIGGHANRRMMDQNLFLKAKMGLAEVVPLEAPYFENEFDRLKIDLFHFHDLSSAVSPLTLSRLAHLCPVIWTMHDCSAFTGGCLYPMGCQKWLDTPACLDCPQHGMWPLDTSVDTAWINYQLRSIAHRAPGLTLVSPSAWLAEAAERSGLPVRPVRVIPNGIAPEPFDGVDRQTMRQSLGIAKDALTLCFSSGHLNDKRKNIRDAVLALRAVDDPDMTVIVLGRMTAEVAEMLEGIRLVAPGFVSDRRELASYYAAADGLVFTSLAENHPLAVLEAMAAGSAVLGYASGGVPEQVTTGVEGLLVETGNRDALLALFSTLPSRDTLNAMGRAARFRFMNCFTLQRMVDDYRELFEAEIGSFSEASND